MSNSLATMRPELVREWSDKNLPLTLDKITYGSNKIVWWKAACGHEWQTSVKARSKGENCPICSGARVIEGINDLATLKPKLAQDWSEKNEIKPTEVSIGSHKKVMWKCRHGHEWEASVKSRTINGTGCPYCSHNKGTPVPLSTFAGEPSQNVGKSFIKSYCAVCLEGAVIVLACIIFSLFAASPPVVNPDAAAVTQVWTYIGELLFNMLVLVGAVKMSDRIIREMMGL